MNVMPRPTHDPGEDRPEPDQGDETSVEPQGDEETDAMASIHDALADLNYLQRYRVLCWALARFSTPLPRPAHPQE